VVLVTENELADLAGQVEAAVAAADILGPEDDGRRQRRRHLLAKLHPDGWRDEPEHSLAKKAFKKVQELLAAELRGTAGATTVTTRTRGYAIGRLYDRGDIANLYVVTYLRDGNEKRGLLKLPRSPKDNDLMAAEARALKTLWATGRRRTVYLPRLEDSFKHRDRTSGIDRQASVLRQLPGFVSLEWVLKQLPQRLDARDAAWIWRRALAALSLAAEEGIVHGSLTPAHVLIHPAEHGVILCGWGNSVEVGDTIKVLGDKDPSLYPSEVLAKEPASTATDIYTLSKTMGLLLNDQAPRQFRAFITGCAQPRPKTRPQDPRVVLGDFDELLARLYGARKFRVFPAMPDWSDK
jgi:serine/threonine protein kinase